jgi:hypothetical protein
MLRIMQKASKEMHKVLARKEDRVYNKRLKTKKLKQKCNI